MEILPYTCETLNCKLVLNCKFFPFHFGFGATSNGAGGPMQCQDQTQVSYTQSIYSTHEKCDHWAICLAPNVPLLVVWWQVILVPFSASRTYDPLSTGPSIIQHLSLQPFLFLQNKLTCDSATCI